MRCDGKKRWREEGGRLGGVHEGGRKFTLWQYGVSVRVKDGVLRWGGIEIVADCGVDVDGVGWGRDCGRLWV